MLLLSGLGIGGNIFSDAQSCDPGLCGSCPPDWTPYDQQCYLFTRHETTWNNAEEACSLYDAHLTSIQGPDQYAFLRRLIVETTGTNTTTWVGGTNLHDHGEWSWVDGTPFTFTNWGPGEPNNAGGNEHCMDINLRGTKTTSL
ncbi:galactose-specific lectin nattectin [Austrofundulus limnaeus]|uniref:Galactose-specific lectin nattectin n=1 Tax=Austrofundulus limnaeus TaxID=52670 RepID=A0A2I4DC33_AUSLI|nr:PREDICTED: galactose-specific lectin nattectin-like [Austrofundulus limnaeus]